MNKILSPRETQGATRRDLVVGAPLVGGALLVGCSPGDLLSVGAKEDFGAFGPFIKIGADGAVTVISKHIEFGQGNHAGLAAIVAELGRADEGEVRRVEEDYGPLAAQVLIGYVQPLPIQVGGGGKWQHFGADQRHSQRPRGW